MDELLLEAESELPEDLFESLGLESPLEVLPPDLFPPFDEYRSAYHPPPLNCTAGAEIRRSSLPLQCGHSVSSGSENFWRFSSVFPQL